MILKEGAECHALISAMWPDLIKLDKAWRSKYSEDLVITSGTDSKHSARTSDHYRGGAVDTRTRLITNGDKQLTGTARETAFLLVKNTLGRNWYVKNESNHFHMSYRPQYRG